MKSSGDESEVASKIDPSRRPPVGLLDDWTKTPSWKERLAFMGCLLDRKKEPEEGPCSVIHPEHDPS